MQYVAARWLIRVTVNILPIAVDGAAQECKDFTTMTKSPFLMLIAGSFIEVKSKCARVGRAAG